MAISPDVVASALQELAPKYEELFLLWHPIFQRVLEKGNRRTLQGPYVEFVVVQGGPGTVTTIHTGSEIVVGGRNQTAVRGNEYAPRMIYAFDVPGKDLAEANGEQDLAQILKNYPELALADFHQRIAQQLAMGNGTDVGAFLTLNGDTTYNPNGTARDGVIDFAPASSQTDTVHGLPKQGAAGGVTGWYNQYGHVTSMAVDGLTVMRQVYYEIQQQSAGGFGPPDILLADQISYLRYLEVLDDHVRFSERVKNDSVPGRLREGIKFLDSTMYLEQAIAPASFTTANAQEGVIYYLSSESMYLFTLGHDASKETKGFFEFRQPVKLPEQDLWRYEIVLHLGGYCNHLRRQGAVTGCNNP